MWKWMSRCLAKLFDSFQCVWVKYCCISTLMIKSIWALSHFSWNYDSNCSIIVGHLTRIEIINIEIFSICLYGLSFTLFPIIAARHDVQFAVASLCWSFSFLSFNIKDSFITATSCRQYKTGCLTFYWDDVKLSACSVNLCKIKVSTLGTPENTILIVLSHIVQITVRIIATLMCAWTKVEILRYWGLCWDWELD